MDPQYAVGEVISHSVFYGLILLPCFEAGVANVVASLAHDAAQLAEALNLLDLSLNEVVNYLVVLVQPVYIGSGEIRDGLERLRLRVELAFLRAKRLDVSHVPVDVSGGPV